MYGEAGENIVELSKFWFFQVVCEPLWRTGTIFVLRMGGLQHAESFLVCIKCSVNIVERMNHVGFQKDEENAKKNGDN